MTWNRSIADHKYRKKPAKFARSSPYTLHVDHFLLLQLVNALVASAMVVKKACKYSTKSLSKCRFLAYSCNKQYFMLLVNFTLKIPVSLRFTKVSSLIFKPRSYQCTPAMPKKSHLIFVHFVIILGLNAFKYSVTRKKLPMSRIYVKRCYS